MQQSLRKKHTDHKTKNQEVTEGINEKDLQNFMLVTLISERAVQVSTTQFQEELIMLTSAFIERGKPRFTG